MPKMKGLAYRLYMRANTWCASALITLLSRTHAGTAITINGITVIAAFCALYLAIAAHLRRRGISAACYQ
jgi:uncharacterized membrane protein YdfJ with MMPL/SSD domain